MELPAATKPTDANFVRVIRKRGSMNQGCHTILIGKCSSEFCTCMYMNVQCRKMYLNVSQCIMREYVWCTVYSNVQYDFEIYCFLSICFTYLANMFSIFCKYVLNIL